MPNQAAHLDQIVSEEDSLKTPAEPSAAWKESFARLTSVQTIIAAISLANLCLINSWFSSHFDADFGYFNKLPVTRVTMAATLANLILLSFVFWSFAQLARRIGRRFVRLGMHLVFFAVFFIPLDFVRVNFLRIADNSLLQFARSPLVICGTLFLLGLLVRWHRIVAYCCARTLLIVSPLVVLTLWKIILVTMGFHAIAQDPGLPSHLAPIIGVTNNARVVWIVFDELDYRTVFGTPHAGISLPEFDRFSAEGLTARHAYPPAGSTLLSIPSLTTGETVTQARPVSPRELELTTNGKNVEWSEVPTVFTESRRLRHNVAVVGWYHPYERLFESALSFCTRFAFPSVEPARARTFAGTMARQICAMVAPLNTRFLHARNTRQSIEDALKVVTNRNFSLVFLHMPIPHKPGIYVPEKGKFTILGVAGPRGYLGNLVLADRTLGSLRRQMEANGTWTDSWVIISSDHWWRKETGNPGTIDYRVPFMIKAPDACPLTYDKPLNTVITHDLVLAILREELKHGAELASWLTRNHGAPAPAYREGAEGD